LEHHPVTQGTRLCLHGTSKGGELALLLAARDPRISKVAALAPQAYCFQGISFSKKAPSWTSGGQDLPFVTVPTSTMLADMARAMWHNTPFGHLNAYREGLAQASNLDQARILIEHAHAELLLCAGGDDQVWTSAGGCQQTQARLIASAYPYRCDTVVYPDAGHSMYYPPYFLPAGLTAMTTGPRLSITTGGTLKANAEAQTDAWNRYLNLFTANTATSPDAVPASPGEEE